MWSRSADIDSSGNVVQSSNDTQAERLEKLRKVRGILKFRDARDKLFRTALFNDPAWELLLRLFAAELDGRTVRSADVLGLVPAIPSSTLLRWINVLEKDGLIVRNQREGQEVVRITMDGLGSMHALFEVLPSGAFL
jgi:hypothetical protein